MSFGNINQIEHNEDSLDNYKKIQNYVYLNTQKLGQGNFSQVFRGIDQLCSRNVAVKVVKFTSLTNKIAQQLLRNQVMILKELNHPNVIRCYDVFTSKNNCYIVTEFCDGGDLEKILEGKKYFQEKELHKIIYGVYQALIYLNQLGIVHRDLKPANILITKDGQPKIADFGFSVRSRVVFKDINIGSPIYMSPQGILKHQYGPKSEVWSFGVMIYELLHGYAPLSYCKDEKSLKETVVTPPKFRQGISYDLRKMLEYCLTVQQKNRIQIKQIIHTSFMKKLYSQFDKPIPPQIDLFSTSHTKQIMKTNNIFPFIKDIVTYDEGLSILQYCRLVHKTAELCPSSILSQWLLDICQSLTRIKLTEGDEASNNNLMTTIKDYYRKYKSEHIDPQINVTVQDVIYECEKIRKTIQDMRHALGMSQKIDQSHLSMLIGETQLIIKCVQSKKIGLYARMSQIQRYLDNIKSKKSIRGY